MHGALDAELPQVDPETLSEADRFGRDISKEAESSGTALDESIRKIEIVGAGSREASRAIERLVKS